MSDEQLPAAPITEARLNAKLRAERDEINHFVLPNDDQPLHADLMKELEAWDRHSDANLRNLDRISKLQAERDEALAALRSIKDDAEASYWELRHWLDTHPKLEWVRGDDGQAYPFMQLAKRAASVLEKLEEL